MGLFDTALLANSVCTAGIAAVNVACILWAASRRGQSKHRANLQVGTLSTRKQTFRVILRTVTAVNVFSPLTWLALAITTLAYREELRSTVSETQPVVAATLALLIVFNFSALVVFFSHLRSCCGTRPSAAKDAELGQSVDTIPLLRPPTHPSDGLKSKPVTPVMAFLLNLDAKLQKVLGMPQAPVSHRKGASRPQSPFAQAAQNQSFGRSTRSTCNGGWQQYGRHGTSQSFDVTSSSSMRSGTRLHRAETAPEGSVKHFLDRDFMATLRSQSRFGSQLSLDSQSCAELVVDVQLPQDIPAHRPETPLAPSATTRQQSLEDWGESLSVSISPTALSPIRCLVPDQHSSPLASPCSIPSCFAPSAGSCKNLEQELLALSHCPESVETELESLLGHAVKGVLLGER